MTGHIVRVASGDLSYNTIDYNSIFSIGLTLFFITLGLNILSRRFVNKFREVVRMSVQAPDRPSESLFPDETGYRAASRRAEDPQEQGVRAVRPACMLTLAVLALCHPAVHDRQRRLRSGGGGERAGTRSPSWPSSGYDPEATVSLGDLDKDELVALLEASVSSVASVAGSSVSSGSTATASCSRPRRTHGTRSACVGRRAHRLHAR
jgi:hypothetical protein